MNFSFSEEQQMLAETVGRYIDKEYSFEARKLALKDRAAALRHWKQFAELGLLGLNVPETYEGLGAGPVETLIVMETLGRGLVIEPYLATAVGAATLIAAVGSDAQKAAMLPQIAAGTLRVALAFNEPGTRYELCPRETTARASGSGFIVNGAKAVALGGRADKVILAARADGDATDHAGITLFCLPVDAPGLEIDEYPNIDGQHSAEIRLREIHVGIDCVLGEVGQGYAPLLRSVDRCLAALCAEAVGAMGRLFDMTIEHLKTRKQFGQQLGQFQALQHRAVELLTLVERSRSMALFAAARADAADPGERRRAVSAAKAFIGRASRRLVKEAIQMHGGMGMTDELAVSHYAKRLLCIDLTLGDAAHHTALFSETITD